MPRPTSALESYEDWLDWTQASSEYSRNRRSRDAVVRRWDRASALAAVLGLAGMVWFVTLSYPAEYWYLGLLAVALAVPYLYRRLF